MMCSAGNSPNFPMAVFIGGMRYGLPDYKSVGREMRWVGGWQASNPQSKFFHDGDGRQILSLNLSAIVFIGGRQPAHPPLDPPVNNC